MEYSNTSAQFVWAATVLEGCRDEIVEDYERLLRGMDSPLLADAEAEEQLRAQAKFVIGGAAGSLRGQDTPLLPEEEKLSEKIGASRARQGLHASESLRAVGLLSEAALLVVLRELSSDASYREVARISVAIQQSILERVMKASVSYSEYLLRAVHKSNADERRRVSRELHDRVGSLLTIVYQNLELYKALKSRDFSRAEGKLESAQQASQDALGAAREISLDLRRPVIQEGLEGELSALLAAIVPPSVRASVSVKGDESLLPPYMRDELFLILREAIRNALIHSGALNVRVELSTSPDLVHAAVRDDGRGFDRESVGFVAGTGLESMKERVYFLGGTLDFFSDQQTGTSVEIHIPLVRGQ